MQTLTPVLELLAVVKNYHALRPLRIRELRVAPGETVAISGLDLPATEVFTGLVTGAMLPDEGNVRVFGEDTAGVSDADEWLQGLDRFGMISDRIALLEGFTVEQNIAVPLTLELDPLPTGIRDSVRMLAHESGVPSELLREPAGAIAPLVRKRVGIARALATNPQLLIVEHPNASLSTEPSVSLAADLYRVVRARRVTAVIVTSAAEFSRQADRHLLLDPATGLLRRPGLLARFTSKFE